MANQPQILSVVDEQDRFVGYVAFIDDHELDKVTVALTRVLPRALVCSARAAHILARRLEKLAKWKVTPIPARSVMTTYQKPTYPSE